jgi:hypothetical protein
MRCRVPVSVSVVVLALAVGVVACGGSDEAPSDGTAAEPVGTGASPGGPGSTAAPGTAAPAAEGAELEDGRHPVVVQRVEVGGRTVTFDLVQWFQGDAAARAAAEDGEESPPPNDYYIRNVNPRLRTLPVAADARLTLTRLTLGQGGGNAAGGVPVDLATVAANGRDHLFWATVQGGRILRLEEQYIP